MDMAYAEPTLLRWNYDPMVLEQEFPFSKRGPRPRMGAR